LCGIFPGAGMFGHFSDSRAGRKGALLLACACTGVTGMVTASAQDYWVYVGCRWLTGVTASGIGLSSFVLATEPVGPSKRGKVGMSAFYFFSLGIMSLPFLAYFSTSWRHLYVLTSLPALVYCAFILPTVYESPRWFVVQGRVPEAMHVLHAFAKRNGSLIPANVDLEIEDSSDPESGEDSSRAPKAASGSLLMVLRSPATRPRMLIMVVIWFLTAVVYYGINLNVVNLGTNLYVGVFLNAVIEWPAFAITALLLDRIGRRSMLASAMLLSGLCCLAGSFLFVAPDEGIHDSGKNWLTGLRLQVFVAGNLGALKGLRILCSVVGVFGMAGTYNLVYIYTSELFPTVVRNAALGFTTQASGVGSIVAPVVVVAGRFNSGLPFAIFGAMAVAGSALSLCLPETLHQPMFETLEGLNKGEKELSKPILA
jgi:OCT family organic cation transporter-like MFS transporter 4/5